MPITRILVPLDLTPLGEAKLPVAEEQAHAFQAELILLHVLPEEAADAEGTVSPEEASARAYLDAITARMHAADVQARPLIGYGPVAAKVLEVASEEDVDLIIIGSNVRRGLSRLFLGSVAEEIVRNAPCPVLLVRPTLDVPQPVTAIRSFADDAARAGPLAPRSLGLRTVEVSRIVGSVGRAAELGADFRPLRRRQQDNERYQRILQAMQQGESLPPVELYKLGYGYYVLDGNHRVAAAKQLGQLEIDAVVTEFVPLGDSEAQRVFVERRAFERATGLTRVGAAKPGTYRRLEQIITQYARQRRFPDLREAAKRWYTEVFRPLAAQIRELRLGEHFPGERTADVFIRLADYRQEVSTRQGRELTWEEVLGQFAAAHRVAE